MVENSIRDNLSKEDIISEIKLYLAADIHYENTVVLVEGEDDVRFLNSFLSDKVALYQSYSGKSGVEFITAEHFKDDYRVIGIRDKDYQISPVCDKIFYYDNCCLEMMIMQNDDIFQKLCSEYFMGKVDSQNLRLFIFEQLKFISVIRMMNERNKWGISMKNLPIAKSWDKNQSNVNQECIYQILKKKNQKFFSAEIIDLIVNEYNQEWDMSDYYNRTQGHDFIVLYTTICNACKDKGIKYKEIEASARCMFRNSDFIESRLYFRLNEYEQLHQLNICNLNMINKVK